jgi:hypothetical protein
MNKYLLLSAAAALATTAAGTAQAGSFSVHYGTSSGGSYCDGLIGASTASYVAGQHIYTHCSPSSVYNKNLEDLGLVMKGDKNIPKKKKGGNAGLSDTTFAVYDADYSVAILFDVETPVAAGGKWDLWEGFGDSGFLGNEGLLLAGQYARVPGKSSQTSVAKLEAHLKGK